MKVKKILKITFGLIIFFTLPTLLFFGFVYFKYNEDLPSGVQGPQADALAEKMLTALNHKAYETTNYLEWTFRNKHHYKWNKANNTCKVYWKNIRVDLDLKIPSKSKSFVNEVPDTNPELIKTATDYFNNDSFWLVAPYKVFDPGVERRIVTLENDNEALLVTYTSGGSTPGDSYLWLLDSNGKPNAYKMWTSILPIQGLEASWSDWTTTESGAQLPLGHSLMFMGLSMGEVIGTQ